MKKFIPILLGSDDNVYGFARSFYDKYKIKPIAICQRRLNATKYSNILNIIEIKNFNNEIIFLKEITELGKKLKKDYEKLLIIPCSDWYLELCVKNSNKLNKYFENKFISEKELDTFVTKDKFYNLCNKFNLTYPKTINCDYKERLEIHKKINFSYPIVLKPNNSNSIDYLNAEFDGKKKAYILNNKLELIETIKNINKSNYKDNLVIQEYIPGDDTSMRVVNCYSDSYGKVKMMCLGRPILEEYFPSTIGNYAAIINIPKSHEIYEEIKNFLEKINYVGFSNFDFKYDYRDKKYKVFEINPRPGRSSFFVTSSGINLAEIITDDLIYKKDIKEIIGTKEEHLWLNVPYKILKKYICNKDILKKIKQLRKEKKITHTLFYKKDFNLKRFLNLKRIYNIQFKLYKKYFIKK